MKLRQARKIMAKCRIECLHGHVYRRLRVIPEKTYKAASQRFWKWNERTVADAK